MGHHLPILFELSLRGLLSCCSQRRVIVEELGYVACSLLYSLA